MTSEQKFGLLKKGITPKTKHKGDWQLTFNGKPIIAGTYALCQWKKNEMIKNQDILRENNYEHYFKIIPKK